MVVATTAKVERVSYIDLTTHELQTTVDHEMAVMYKMNPHNKPKTNEKTRKCWPTLIVAW